MSHSAAVPASLSDAAMATARRYGEPIIVRNSDPAAPDAAPPAHFLWRERVYRVLAVLAEWRETGAWWEGTETGRAAVGQAAADCAVFRVMAATGRQQSPGQFDLCHRTGDGQWLLVRVDD